MVSPRYRHRQFSNAVGRTGRYRTYFLLTTLVYAHSTNVNCARNAGNDPSWLGPICYVVLLFHMPQRWWSADDGDAESDGVFCCFKLCRQVKRDILYT